MFRLKYEKPSLGELTPCKLRNFIVRVYIFEISTMYTNMNNECSLRNNLYWFP